jgi:hypothetical protein
MYMKKRKENRSYTQNRPRLLEQKLLEDGRPGELGIKQYAAKNNERYTLARCTMDLLEKVRKANPPLLQKLGAEARCRGACQYMDEARTGKWGGAGPRVQLDMQPPVGGCRVDDLQTIDLGGNGGIEPTRWGNVCTSLCRRSSKSEYLDWRG